MKRIKSPIKRFAVSRKISGSGAGIILGQIASRIAGKETVNGFMTLAEAVGGMYNGFHERVKQLHKILSDPSRTSIILVSAATSSALSETGKMVQELVQASLPLKAIIFNRITPPLNTNSPSSEFDMSKSRLSTINEQLIAELPVFMNRYCARIKSETILMNRFMGSLSRHIVSYRVPLHARDIHSLTDLAALHPYLYGVF